MTRLGEKAVIDRAELDRLLDSTILAHVGLADGNGGAVVIPTAFARDGDSILLHGSTGAGWMRRAAHGSPACVTVTELDGIVVARSSFESSFRYRSAVLFGTFTRLPAAELSRALDLLTERFIPGRVAELRRPSAREVSAGWPDDEDEDIAGDAWAGVVEYEPRQFGTPQPAPDLRPGIAVPRSVRALAGP
jgi:nitroimidazol reductase NimA-like FMN-containing flavoprotein (pyridoxamine 5'-phosphate oxidase superfamily)